MKELRLIDFVAENDDVTLDAFSERTQKRIDDALADLTGTDRDPAPGGAGNIVVSKDRDSSEAGIFNSISEAINDGDTEPGDTIYVEPGTYDENLAIGSPDAGTDPESAPKRNLRIVGQRRPTVDGFVQILDTGITFEGFEVTGEVFEFGIATFEPDVTIRDVVVSGVTNGIFLGRKEGVSAENCRVENYSFYGLLLSGRGEFQSESGVPTVTGSTFDGASGGGAVGIGVIETPAKLTDNETSGHEFEGEGAGIAHFSGAGVSIQENTIEDNDDGIYFAGPDADTATATRNDIVDNGTGVVNEGESEVDATKNWWGKAGGPPGKNGNASEGSVDTDPWSTAAGPDWNSSGTSDQNRAEASGFSISSFESSGGSDPVGIPRPDDPDPAE